MKIPLWRFCLAQKGREAPLQRVTLYNSPLIDIFRYIKGKDYFKPQPKSAKPIGGDKSQHYLRDCIGHATNVCMQLQEKSERLIQT